jgi:hypothetical protein
MTATAMTRVRRLGAAAIALLGPLACVEEAPPPAPPPPPVQLVVPPALPPLQIATSQPLAIASPGFLRCDGVGARSGDTVFCFDEQPRTFREAEEHCEQIGGHLADIRTAEEARVLRAAFGAPLDLPNTLWIGLVEPFRRGEWGWMSGTRAAYQNWHAGEPNDAGGGEDCGERLSATGTWNDVDCAAARGFLCEGPPIPSGGKAAAKSSAFKCSGTPIQAGDTPMCVHTDRALDAAHAEQFCKANGGQLAEPRTPEKDKALFAALGPRAGNGEDVWIGLTDAAREGDWRSPAGLAPTFTAWRAGEPNNVGPGGENCATWGPLDGRWNDLRCDARAQSICRGVVAPAQ